MPGTWRQLNVKNFTFIQHILQVFKLKSKKKFKQIFAKQNLRDEHLLQQHLKIIFRFFLSDAPDFDFLNVMSIRRYALLHFGSIPLSYTAFIRFLRILRYFILNVPYASYQITLLMVFSDLTHFMSENFAITSEICTINPF